ncbi:MAG: LysR substrate-binding domain-containing protein, partial [Myxococcota bacterium]
RTRRVGLTVPSFALAPYAVAGTDLVLAAPRELVAPLCERFGLALAPLPLPVPPIPVVMTWPERLHADAGHRWLRDRVARVVAAFTSDARR